MLAPVSKDIDSRFVPHDVENHTIFNVGVCPCLQQGQRLLLLVLHSVLHLLAQGIEHPVAVEPGHGDRGVRKRQNSVELLQESNRGIRIPEQILCWLQYLLQRRIVWVRHPGGHTSKN